LFDILLGSKQLLKIKQQFGCGSPPLAPYPIFGSSEPYKFVKAFNEHIFLRYVQKLFDSPGHTFTGSTLWIPAVWTDKPPTSRNIFLCSYKFRSDANRCNKMLQLLGNSIFTSEG
jgi:hypothetical protein